MSSFSFSFSFSLSLSSPSSVCDLQPQILCLNVLFILSYISLSCSGFYIQYKKYKDDKINDTIKTNFDITYNGKK